MTQGNGQKPTETVQENMQQEASPPEATREARARQLQARRLTEKQARDLDSRMGKVFRFVRQYMHEHHVQMQHQMDSVFTATRCVQCKRAVVFFDTSRFIPQASSLIRVLRLAPSQERGSRPQYINVCPHCGRWHGRRMIEQIHQQNREQEDQTCVIFSGVQYLLWLESQDLQP